MALLMGDKSVGYLMGIRKVLGKKFEDKGFDKVQVILVQFLVLKKDKDVFWEWFKETCGVNAKQSQNCFGCLQ
ncbi:barrier-to-autointegration factor-like [Gracilinanus agilis]|uniref:barrier-to-autointegration factor-like n=1 Tax=Gracilinanus agilis TaxID=191870 RepID=UPI001CFEBAE3|nr:barrier-to-autointegration factor-like [Gracilinanus agilis]